MARNTDRSLAELANALRDGSVRAEALWAEADDNYRRLDGDLRAYFQWSGDLGAGQAKAADAAFAAGHDLGALQGIPGSVKDLFGVAGYPTHAGTPNRLPPAWEDEGPVMRAFRRQSPIISGKTQMVEFAYGGIGANSHWGTPRNPWDAGDHRAPGGSSAGAGVSLAQGSAWIAFGSDTAGSIRVPAGFTGCAGLKITHGRWSLDGIVPLSPSLDTPGFLARSVADLAFAFYALDPAHDRRPPPTPLPRIDAGSLTLGTHEAYFWNDLSPGIGEAVDAALGELEAKGARRRSIDLPELETAHELFLKGALAAPELYAFLIQELPAWIDTLDPLVAQRVKAGADMPTHEYLRRVAVLRATAAAADARLAEVDALVSPTVALTPPVMSEIAEPEAYVKANMLTLRNTFPGNLLRLCAVTLPCGLDAAGMPVGLQIMCRAGQEERLLAIALGIEDVLGNARSRIGTPPAVS